MIVMIKLQRSPLGGESVYSLFHYVVMVKNWITFDGGAPDEWVMKVMQTWKKLFFNCANPAKLIGVRLNLEVTIKWKYLPFSVRKDSCANYNVPPYSLLRWFPNLADSQPSRVKGQLCMAKKRASSFLLVLGGFSTANFYNQSGSLH